MRLPRPSAGQWRREVHGAPARIDDDFYTTGIVDQLRIERSCGGPERLPAFETRERATHGGGCDEGLVALDVQDVVEVAKLRLGNDFRDALSPGGMVGRGQDGLKTSACHDMRDLFGVSRNDKAIANAEFGDAACDDEDEGFAR